MRKGMPMKKEQEKTKEKFPKCDRRLKDDMCGAIGCCEIGDTPCQCIVCNHWDKEKGVCTDKKRLELIKKRK